MSPLKWLAPLAVSGFALAARAEPLTFAEALARAVPSAPDIGASAQATQAARSASRAAGALPDPKAFVGVDDFPVSGPLAGRPNRDNFSMLTVGIEQDVPNRAKRRARTERARADITAAETQELLARRNVEVATAIAWIDLYYAERRLALLDSLARELRKEVDAQPAQLAAGSVRPGATVEPEQALAELADHRAGLAAERQKAEADLRRWIGGDTAAEVAGAAPKLPVDPVRLRANLDQLPELRVKSAAIGQAEAEAHEAKAEKQSDWGYSVSYSHRDPRFGDYVSGRLTFSLPLFSATRQDPLIAARLADVNRGVLEREATRRDLAAALDKDLADHAMHDALLVRARETLFPLAKRRLDLETASYGAAKASLADVLAAQRALVETELEILDREAAVVRDGARIALTYGSDQ